MPELLSGRKLQVHTHTHKTHLFKQNKPCSHNRPLSFKSRCCTATTNQSHLQTSSLSHSNYQSQSTTKFYNSSKADVEGNVLTLCAYYDLTSLDAHRLSKISDSFNLFTEKEALIPDWLMSLFFFSFLFWVS